MFQIKLTNENSSVEYWKEMSLVIRNSGFLSKKTKQKNFCFSKIFNSINFQIKAQAFCEMGAS